MGKRGSLVYQARQRLMAMAAYGESKHSDKAVNGGLPSPVKIYSYSTMHNYIDASVRFCGWARAAHGCKTLEEARQFTGDYLRERMAAGKSAWTVARDAAALAKLYGTSSDKLGAELPTRHRSEVTQHRTGAEHGHFSENRNRDLVDLCRATGLRRHEITQITAENVGTDSRGNLCLHDVKGKGGKVREIPVLPQYAQRIKQIAEAAQAEQRPLIEHVPKYAPCHRYRAEYARELYTLYARDMSTLPRSEVYSCRSDLAGEHYDKAAMAEVSAALGHARLDVVVSYLH